MHQKPKLKLLVGVLGSKTSVRSLINEAIDAKPDNILELGKMFFYCQ